MKVYFVRDEKGDFNHRQYMGIYYKQSEEEKETLKQNALKLAQLVKDVPMPDFYVYFGDSVISAGTFQDYYDVFCDNGRVVDCAEHLKTENNLSSKAKRDKICENVSNSLLYNKLKYDAEDTFLHTPKDKRPKTANKVMPYLFAAAGLSRLVQVPNYKFRKNIYNFLNQLTEKHSDNDVILIFSDNSVFKAMQKYPELHEFCYFGDEEVPFADGNGYDSKVKVEPSGFHEFIIEKPAYVESRQRNMPVYEKYAVPKYINGENKDSQKGE